MVCFYAITAPALPSSERQPIYDWLGDGKGGHVVLGGALWVGALFCLLSLLSAFGAGWMDRVSVYVHAPTVQARQV